MKAIKSVKPVNSCDCDSVNKEIVEKVCHKSVILPL